MVLVDADVLVLSEFRSRGPLSEMLASHGWTHQVGTPDPRGGYAAVLVASRRPLREIEPHYADDDCAQRWVNVEVVGTGWSVAGALIPGYHREHPLRKQSFWDFVVSEYAPANADRPALLIGDLNTGLHGIDERGATLRCADSMLALRNSGWIDVWHVLRPGVRPPPSWWEPATGNGFRLDHAFLSPGSPPPIGIDYVNEIGGAATTRAGARKTADGPVPLSDHVPLVVDLSVG